MSGTGETPAAGRFLLGGPPVLPGTRGAPLPGGRASLPLPVLGERPRRAVLRREESTAAWLRTTPALVARAREALEVRDLVAHEAPLTQAPSLPDGDRP